MRWNKNRRGVLIGAKEIKAIAAMSCASVKNQELGALDHIQSLTKGGTARLVKSPFNQSVSRNDLSPKKRELIPMNWFDLPYQINKFFIFII
jgi:hypothetical protein